jgi:hypothetical protein
MRLDSWLTGALPFGWANANIAVNVGNIIADKSISIIVTRDGAQLAAQTARLEPIGDPSQRSSDNALTANSTVMILGYKGHPTITDTNLTRGDRFFVGGIVYEVVQVQPGYTDRLIAICEAIR